MVVVVPERGHGPRVFAASAERSVLRVYQKPIHQAHHGVGDVVLLLRGEHQDP